MCFVITINDKGINVIDIGRLRSRIKDANILYQWNTSCVPSPEPTTEPTALVSGGGMLSVHLLEPSKIKDFLIPFRKGAQESEP